jgi:Fe-S cluster assembly protein SufD
MKSLIFEPKENMVFSPTEDTQYIAVLPSIEPSKSSLEVRFEKEGVSCEIIILGNLKQGVSTTLNTISNHLVPNTSCITYYYNVLGDSALSDYTGKIIIAKNSYQTNSYLNNKTLVVGVKTKNVTRPTLEIEAGDVKASHGSSTGRVREEDIFYLTSRGLSRNEAEQTIVEGFFESVLFRIVDLEVREKVRDKLKS